MCDDKLPHAREQHRMELMEMWHDRRGRNVVLSLFHNALPNGESARAGMSVFDVILMNEFGQAPAEDRAPQMRSTAIIN